MFYGYRIQSLKYPERNCVGYSADLKQRIADHNTGKNRFTAPFRPWKHVFYAAFDKEQRARNFEKYQRLHLERHSIQSDYGEALHYFSGAADAHRIFSKVGSFFKIGNNRSLISVDRKSLSRPTWET